VILSVGVVGAASLAGSALAAVVVGGATYAGHLGGAQSTVSISLRVSANGREVQQVHLSKLPIYCSGKGPPAAKLTFQPATVSSAGRFTASGADSIAVGPLKGTAVARLTLTGAFAPGRRESGTFAVHYVGGLSTCDGHSPYSTTA